MMDVSYEGREVCVRLRDDVWVMEEPGTLCLTRTQAQLLRLHLNELGADLVQFDHQGEEDG